MDAARREDRFQRVRDALGRDGAAWLLLPPSADFRWLAGVMPRSSERLFALAVPRDGAPFCIVPRLEAGALAAECPWLERIVWDDHEDPLERLASRLELESHPALLLGEGFRVGQVLRVASATACRPAADVVAPLRAVKDAGEIGSLEAAARHADQIVEQAADHMRPGMSERELERFVLQRFDALGDSAPWAIVASGPNSAHPHHVSSERRLSEGDVVILDVGAYTDGYGSDITRTYWLGEPPAEAERVYDIVDRARATGIESCRSDVTAATVDQATRAVIEAAGYGEYFTHRTGHGVGLEIHEPPYIVAGNREPLRTGMVHSVEPGIYLPGRFGVRIEDLVVVAPGGARALNHAPRDPQPLRTRA